MESNHVVIAGASGVIGQNLIHYFLEKKWKISVFTHQKIKSNPFKIDQYHWNPSDILNHKKEIPTKLVDIINSATVLINLAGSSLMSGRFGKLHRYNILHSRLDASNALIKLYKQANHKPTVWIQASAIGYYGDVKERSVDESSSMGHLFLSKVCDRWEKAVGIIEKDYSKKTRLLTCRFGLVFDQTSPAWKRLLFPIKLGFGGPIGRGMQWWSWIHKTDLILAIDFLLNNKNSKGVYNLVAPHPIRQRVLVKTIAKLINRPAVFRKTHLAIKLMMGSGAKEVLLPSTKAKPTKLLSEGFHFTYPVFDQAVVSLLGNTIKDGSNK